jgi:hypothetical protein
MIFNWKTYNHNQTYSFTLKAAYHIPTLPKQNPFSHYTKD